MSTEGTACAPAAMLQGRLVELSVRARGIDVRPFETLPAARVIAELVPPTARLLDDTLALHASVADEWDTPVSVARAAADDDGDDTARISRDLDSIAEDAGGRTADVAFLAAVHLRGRRKSLSGFAPAADGWVVVAACGSAVRQVAKSLAAVEGALATEHGLPRRLTLTTELAHALEIRRRYADLRAVIVGQTPAGPRELEATLRRIGSAIAILIGKSIYPHLRIPDRIQLRAVQGRVLDWLRTPAPDEREGRRILQDLIGVADMLALVSRRQELVEHDQRVARRVFGALGAHATVPGALLTELSELRGLDPSLDRLIDRRSDSPSEWRAGLRSAGLAPAGTELDA